MSERFTGLAAAATTIALLGGCSLAPHEPAPQSQATEVATPDGGDLQTASQDPAIDLGRPDLPGNINQLRTNTVEIVNTDLYVKYRDTNGRDMNGKIWETFGSGTVITYKGGKFVVTAAHVQGPSIEHCADGEIHGLTADGGKGVVTTITESSPVVGEGEEYDNDTYNGGLDAAVVKPTGNELKKYSGVPVQDTVDINVGDTVFSMGYGPRHKVDPDPQADDKNTRQPVIVPGTVVDVTDNQVYFLTTPGYKPTIDDAVESGDSGGGFYESDGGYLGDVIATYEDWETGTQIEEEYDVDLPKSAAKQKFSIAIAQIVDTETLDGLVGSLEPCTTKPPYVQTVKPGTDVYNLPRPNVKD